MGTFCSVCMNAWHSRNECFINGLLKLCSSITQTGRKVNEGVALTTNQIAVDIFLLQVRWWQTVSNWFLSRYLGHLWLCPVVTLVNLWNVISSKSLHSFAASKSPDLKSRAEHCHILYTTMMCVCCVVHHTKSLKKKLIQQDNSRNHSAKCSNP